MAAVEKSKAMVEPSTSSDTSPSNRYVEAVRVHVHNVRVPMQSVRVPIKTVRVPI
jgi:hypothetical protein